MVIPTSPLTGPEGEPLAGPEKILDSRIGHRRRREVNEVLVKWHNLPEEAATWEDTRVLQVKYPEFIPCGQVMTEEGRIVSPAKMERIEGSIKCIRGIGFGK